MDLQCISSTRKRETHYADLPSVVAERSHKLQRQFSSKSDKAQQTSELTSLI